MHQATAQNTIFRQLALMLAGALSTALAVGIVMGLERALDLDLFSLMHCAVIPTGAFAVGAVAASGYYFGARALHQRPTGLLAVNMVATALSAQLVLYYVRYATLDVGHGQVARDVTDFATFVKVYLSHAQYTIGHTSTKDAGIEVGAFGYVIAGVQTLGLLSSGFVTWSLLTTIPYCDECSRFLGRITGFTRSFGSEVDANAFLQSRAAEELADPAHLAQIAALPGPPSARPAKGQLTLNVALYRCPSCGGEVVAEDVQIFDGRQWSTQAAHHTRGSVPAGTSLESWFAEHAR